jgi:hypothetical protein
MTRNPSHKKVKENSNIVIEAVYFLFWKINNLFILRSMRKFVPARGTA